MKYIRGFIEFFTNYVMSMKTNSVIGAVILVVVIFLTTGCEEADKSQFNLTSFPTNHWKVVGQGTNGQVVVETTSTNLLQYFRVHLATAVVPLTNGQSARLEVTTRWNPRKGVREIISSMAYPAME